jgi:hypothetical protein
MPPNICILPPHTQFPTSIKKYVVEECVGVVVITHSKFTTPLQNRQFVAFDVV